MNKMMVITLLLILSATTHVMAGEAGTQYEMRVDGLACPYCAYGIEKKLLAIDGMQKFDVDLEKGLVMVAVGQGVILTESQMKQLFNDAGFTFRSMTSREVSPGQEEPRK